MNRRFGRKRPLTGPRLAATFCRIHSITRGQVKSCLNSARPDSEVKAPSVRRASNRCLFRKTTSTSVESRLGSRCRLARLRGQRVCLSRAARRFCPPKCHCDPRATTVSMWRTRNPTSTSNRVHTCASGRCRGDAEQDANVLEPAVPRCSHRGPGESSPTIWARVPRPVVTRPQVPLGNDPEECNDCLRLLLTRRRSLPEVAMGVAHRFDTAARWHRPASSKAVSL